MADCGSCTAGKHQLTNALGLVRFRQVLEGASSAAERRGVHADELGQPVRAVRLRVHTAHRPTT